MTETISLINEKIKSLEKEHEQLEIRLIRLNKGMTATSNLYKKRLQEIKYKVLSLDKEKRVIELVCNKYINCVY